MKSDDFLCTGYERADGTKGIRNKILIIYTVECSMHVCQRVAEYFQTKNEDVEVVGSIACLDNQVIIRRLLRYSIHPNVGATLVIGMGCEHTQPHLISEFARKNGRLSEWFSIQEVGGTAKGIELGIKIISDQFTKIKKTKSVPMVVGDLIVGGECGGSDFTSGLAGNALVGSFFDRLVDCHATAIFEELCEAIGLCDYLVSRGVNEDVGRQIALTYKKTVDYCKAYGVFSISPGNMTGGLSTIEEKSMGSTAKSGTRPIQGVLKIAETPKKKGLWLLDMIPDERLEPCCFLQAGDATDMLELIASNCHIVLLVTGRGHVVGAPISPVIKITGNPRTYAAMSDDIDINASAVLCSEKTMDALTDELFAYVKAVCNGTRSHAERLGHREGSMFFNYQAPNQVLSGCCFTKNR